MKFKQYTLLIALGLQIKKNIRCLQRQIMFLCFSENVHIMVLPVAETIEKQLMVVLRDREKDLTDFLGMIHHCHHTSCHLYLRYIVLTSCTLSVLRKQASNVMFMLTIYKWVLSEYSFKHEADLCRQFTKLKLVHLPSHVNLKS